MDIIDDDQGLFSIRFKILSNTNYSLISNPAKVVFTVNIDEVLKVRKERKGLVESCLSLSTSLVHIMNNC